MRTVLQVLGKHTNRKHVENIVSISTKQVELLKLHMHDLLDMYLWTHPDVEECSTDISFWEGIRDRYSEYLKEL